MPLRRIPLTGAVNFRDIGGYPTLDGKTLRWNHVYRSDSLAELDAADLASLAELGIRTLCDFRLPEEAARKPNRLPADHRIRVEPIGFIPTGTLDMLASIADGSYGPASIEREVLIHYRKFVRDHTAEYGRMFSILLEEDALPLLMHCTSGKDRTGFGVAALLTALGVPREIIVADYAITNDHRRDIAHLFAGKVSPEALATLTSANPRYIETALDEIPLAFGSVEAWLEELGVDGRRRALLAERLTV
jgi:protein-tyrosine phosphatase